MQKIVLPIFLFIVGICSCYGQTIHFKQIEAVNLEEDKGPFASMNDEIILIQASIDLANDSLMVWEYTPIIILSDSISSTNVNFESTLTMDTTVQWLFILLEVDTRLSPQDLSENIQSVFLEYAGYPSTLLKEKIRLQMGDDDLLGFLYLGQKQVNKLDDVIRFRGMHMFNRYEYLVQLRIDN